MTAAAMQASAAVAHAAEPEVGDALSDLARIRWAKNLLEQVSSFTPQASGWNGARTLVREPEIAREDAARLLTTWTGGRIDVRSPQEIMTIWKRERQGLNAAYEDLNERTRLWPAALWAAPTERKETRLENLDDKLSISAILGSVRDEAANASGIVSFLAESRHDRAIESIVLAPVSDGPSHCGGFEYAPALPLRAGATQRVIAATTREQAACASYMRLTGFRDDANRNFGATYAPLSPDESKRQAWFYRTAAFGPTIRAITLQQVR